MKVIEQALKEALTSTMQVPRAGWWGFKSGDMHYICRYGHVMIKFTSTDSFVETCETRTDRAGVKDALEQIKRWQADPKV